MNRHGLAFDRASVRTINQDGRLCVEITNISKANVCPYRGDEIPDGEALGLDPQKVYQLLRDPEELTKAAPTFNSIPLIVIHKPTTANDHAREIVVGTTGSDAAFDAPYLRNSLMVWDAEGIELIESKKQQELSCGYRYEADMTPGTFDGISYDGVMRNIFGNHVALVAAGRAGPDVFVGDSQLEQINMSKPLSRKAAMAKGALLAHLKPKLAADARLNLNPILAGVTAANWGSKKAGIAAAIKPKLAADADIEDLVQLLDSLDGTEDNVGLDDDADPAMGAVDAGPIDDILSMLKGKISDEDYTAIETKLSGLKLADAEPDPASEPAAVPTANDAPVPTSGAPAVPAAAAPATPKKDDSVSKTAMDAALKIASKNAEDAAIKRMRDVHAAESAIQPWVGKLALAQDSAEGVYRAALETLGIDVSDIHPSAFRAVLNAQPKPGAQQPSFAADSAQPNGFEQRFPNAHVRKV